MFRDFYVNLVTSVNFVNYNPLCLASSQSELVYKALLRYCSDYHVKV